jgi:DHA2 family multidrug resistance protein
LSGLASAGLTPDQALGTINRLVDQQAYMLAASDVFYASSLIFLALIPVVFLTRHTKAGAGSADAAAGAH